MKHLCQVTLCKNSRHKHRSVLLLKLTKIIWWYYSKYSAHTNIFLKILLQAQLFIINNSWCSVIPVFDNTTLPNAFIFKEPVDDICVDLGEEELRVERDVHIACLDGLHRTWTRKTHTCEGNNESFKLGMLQHIELASMWRYFNRSLIRTNTCHNSGTGRF